MGSFQLKIVENSTAESEGNFGSVLNCSESAEKGELLVYYCFFFYNLLNNKI